MKKNKLRQIIEQIALSLFASKADSVHIEHIYNDKSILHRRHHAVLDIDRLSKQQQKKFVTALRNRQLEVNENHAISCCCSATRCSVYLYERMSKAETRTARAKARAYRQRVKEALDCMRT